MLSELKLGFVCPCLAKKVAHSYKYYLTQLGQAVLAVGLTIKEMLVVPELAGIKSFGY
ncbi:MAG: hypothetical protein HY232_15745 [Acidobacteria bacterium]|nr:hypothetical protein [Acidobacteriota bacterium]